MAIAGVTFGITEGTGFGRVAAGMKPMERFGKMAERGLLNVGVRASLGGQKLEQSLKNELGSTMLAMGQSVIGDIGINQGLSEGSLGKTLMHGALGGAFSQSTSGKFSSGAMAGAMGEVLAPVMPSAQSVSAVTSAVVLASGGNARDIEAAGQISGSVVENNFLAHSRAVDNMMLKRLESEGTISEGKAQELIEYNDEGRLKGLELSTDVMSVIASGGNPEGVVAKRMVLESIKSGTKKIGHFLSKKVNKVEKLSEPVSGKVIDHMPSVREVITSSVNRKGVKATTNNEFLLPPSKSSNLNSSNGINGPSLLYPNEGKVASYGELSRISKHDSLDAHHGPNDKYMSRYGISKNDGISILIRQSLHREIHKKLKNQDPNLTPREALAESILRTREVYKENNLYLPGMREGLLEKIKQSKEKHPNLFEKN